PRRARAPARRHAGRARVHAAPGNLPVAGTARRLRAALATAARAHDHCLRGPDAARPDRPGRAPEGRMSGAVPLLAAENLSRSFGGLRAVDEVSLSLERGLLHAVIGTNGAGKSTLINLLSGELAASSGRVRLLGEDVTGWTQ